MVNDNNNGKQPKNKFVSFLKAVFVHNIGWKLFALASASLIWFLSVGLAGLWTM